MCIKRLVHVHQTFGACTSNVWCMCIKRLVHVHQTFGACASNIWCMYIKRLVHVQWRVQEFVRGGGEHLKPFFFCFLIIQGGGGAAPEIAEKMIFPTKKVAKYR